MENLMKDKTRIDVVIENNSSRPVHFIKYSDGSMRVMVEDPDIQKSHKKYGKELEDALFENRRMEAWFKAIVDYECIEVCKDSFAYDRLMKNLKDAARRGLGISIESEE